MPALHPAPARPAGANRHLELTDDHARDRQLFLHLGGHTRQLQHPAAVRAVRRQRHVMPFIDAHRRPAARGHTIRGAGSPVRPLRRTAERFRKRRRLAAPGPTRRVQLPIQPRILVFQPPIALVQPGDLALEPFELALDALKLAPQSFPSPGLGLLLRVSLPSHKQLMPNIRRKYNPRTWIRRRDPVTNYRIDTDIPSRPNISLRSC